jgi:hypothetical protein
LKNKVTTLCYDKDGRQPPRRKKMEEVSTSQKRVRINLSQTSKGLVQLDITAESESVEESKKILSEAIDSARAVIKEKGMTEVSA